MNRENMTKLRDHLAWLRDNDKADKFNMGVYLSYHNIQATTVASLSKTIHNYTGKMPVISATECGTVACIAGHAALIGGCHENDLVPYFALRWLDLTGDEAADLFFGAWSSSSLHDVTIDDVITELDRLLDEQQEEVT